MTTKVDADIELGKIEAEVDLGLDDINASVDLGKIDADIDIGLDDINANANANVGLNIGKIDAAVAAKVDADVKADVKADADVRAQANLVAAIKELAPLLLQFAWKEIPLVRVGFPHRYKLGFCLFGCEVASVTFCGESELVTEDSRCHKEQRKP
jgi:hypothetical protein